MDQFDYGLNGGSIGQMMELLQNEIRYKPPFAALKRFAFHALFRSNGRTL
jgi:hypothetical protein